jgi:hypothetical protein
MQMLFVRLYVIATESEAVLSASLPILADVIKSWPVLPLHFIGSTYKEIDF